jgi:hypothetical protein
VAELTEGEKPQFKTPMPQTPATKILAVGTFAPSVPPPALDSGAYCLIISRAAARWTHFVPQRAHC